MLRLLHDEFMEALAAEQGDTIKREMSLATGRLPYPYILRLVEAMQDKFPNTTVEVTAIRNDFFGESITVSGLVTAQDLITQMRGKVRGGQLLIPCNMLKVDEDIFLDDYTVEDVEKALQTELIIVQSGGQDLLDAILRKR